ncbi:MAG: hypothetical protein N3E47_01310 [Candidatus Bathyarchaeota archaeon]|nr:hypothetical protein [Candidatus Bathyarchaeota archaeon]
MIGEEEVIKFLRERGGATLEDISSVLKIPKYGPNSAYDILHSLKSKNIAERRGSIWVLTDKTRAQTIIEEEDSLGFDKSLEKLTRTIREAVMGQQKLIDIAVPKEDEKGRENEAAKLRCQKTLVGLKTGTFLDSLFFSLDGEPLGGIPASGQLALIGPLGAGKSLLASEIALRVSSERKTLFVVLDDVWESNRVFDLQSRMRVRSETFRLDWERLSKNLYVFSPQCINGEFLGEYERIISGCGADLSLLDSVNQVEHQNVYKHGESGLGLADIVNVNRAYGVTGIFVIHSGLNYMESTQISVGSLPLWLMDCVISITPVELAQPYPGINFSGIKGIERLRIAQIFKCRLCGFDGRGILFGITRRGLIKPLEFDDSEG